MLQQWGGGGGLGVCGESGCGDWAALREAAADRMHSLHLLGYTAAGYVAMTWEGSLYWTAAVICAACVLQGVLMPVVYARVWGRRLTRASCFAACFGVSVGGTWLLVLGPLGCLLLVQVFARAVRSDVNGGSDYGDVGVGRAVATLLCAVGCCVCALMVCGVALYSRLRLAPRWYVKGQCGERAVQQKNRLLSYGAWFALGRGYVGPVQLRRACYPLVAWYDRAHWGWATLPLWPGSMAVAAALVAAVAEAVAGDEGKEGAGAVCYGGCFVLAGLHVAVGAWVGVWKRPFRSPLAGLLWLAHWVCVGMHHLFHGIVAMRVEGAEDEAELARLFTTGGGRVVTWWSYYDEAGGDATWFEWALYMSTVFLLLHIALTCVWCASAVCVFVADSPVGPWLPHVNRDLSFGAMEEERLDAEAATMMARGRLAEAGMLLLQRQRLYDGALSEWRAEGGISPQVMAEWKRVSVRYAACRGHNPKRAVRVAEALKELPQPIEWYCDAVDSEMAVHARAMSAAIDRCTKWHDQCPSRRRAALEDAPQLVSVDVVSWSANSVRRASMMRPSRKGKHTHAGRIKKKTRDVIQEHIGGPSPTSRVSPPISAYREGIDDFSDALSGGSATATVTPPTNARRLGRVRRSRMNSRIDVVQPAKVDEHANKSQVVVDFSDAFGASALPRGDDLEELSLKSPVVDFSDAFGTNATATNDTYAVAVDVETPSVPRPGGGSGLQDPEPSQPPPSQKHGAPPQPPLQEDIVFRQPLNNNIDVVEDSEAAIPRRRESLSPSSDFEDLEDMEDMLMRDALEDVI